MLQFRTVLNKKAPNVEAIIAVNALKCKYVISQPLYPSECPTMGRPNQLDINAR